MIYFIDILIDVLYGVSKPKYPEKRVKKKFTMMVKYRSLGVFCF